MGVLPLPLPLLLLAAGTRASGRDLEGHLDLVSPTSPVSPGRCRFALGMEDGSIPDSRLSASSAWSDSTAARHGRLGRSDGDGAWCPAGPVFPEEEEFLEVDLGGLHVVTLVGTQGRHAGGHGREFARAYRLRYSRDRHRWLRWRDRWGAEGTGISEDNGILGRSWAGLLSYTAPRGQVMALDPAPVVLNDSTYDGYSVGLLQFGGLGQLTDGGPGLGEFKSEVYDFPLETLWLSTAPPCPHQLPQGIMGWWPTPSIPQVHCNNMHTRGVAIFEEVECHFKRSLATAWEPTPATHSLAGGVKDPSARTVTVPLGGRQARFIQCHFFFAGEWMLFSEITFLSDTVEEAVGGRGGAPARPYWKKILGKAQRRPSEDELRVQLSVPGDTIVINNATGAGRGPPRYERIPPGPGEYQEPTRPWPSLPPAPPGPAPGEPKPGQPIAKADHSHTSILIGCLVAIILLLLGVIILILWRQYWKKILGKAQRRPSEDELRVQLSVPGDTIVINNATGGGPATSASPQARASTRSQRGHGHRCPRPPLGLRQHG
ncbi:epithelial discoidin domain-containing receptor 1 [Egretta garzetta]|uniref:epithelial discoidin domain-containing receptor 1 n=1 Tax=Egretta garzetta TaxID=188379 RepID=UPI00163BE88F|nr:epithelial discoidin domain-containing receptor 1 [Egretta garzetta]